MTELENKERLEFKESNDGTIKKMKATIKMETEKKWSAVKHHPRELIPIQYFTQQKI